ncbi:MAG TPA: adenylate/guanylate cyclase domain-containing protein [Bradyrhizobium sp.]|jgi:adenylate cyclase|nr:adenylate/guanylate cyclase domain-containing protein [Bradyrhizobium sp.]
MAALTGEAERERSTMQGFHRALTREILVTEQLRIKAVLATILLFGVALTVMHLIFPDSMERIWRGQFALWKFYVVAVPLVIFEVTVLWLLQRHIALNHDVPVLRRYFSALIETSLPTIALAIHMNAMGAERALGFAAPLAYFVFIILSTLRLDFWLSTFTGLVAAVELFAMAMLYHPVGVFAEAAQEPGYNIIRSILLVVGGVLAGAVGLQLRRQFEASIAASTARDRVTNLFGQHVSPQVVERLLAAGAGGASEVRHVAVMFVDFRNFTGAARVRTPQQVVDRLDGVFAVLVDILDRHHGIVNKFLGDGFLALFGAPIDDPDAARRAVAAAREMLEAMAENNAGDEWQLRIGIGIHMGNVVAGNVGSPRRKEYTVIGDTVNFAARLETLNKEFGSQLLISADVRDVLSEACSDAESLGAVPVKGYDEPQTVWKLG